jgi:hypothetical protein
MRKRGQGELTSRQIILFVVAVFAFIVVLGFLFMMDWSGQSTRAVCEQDILLRATAPALIKGYVPLKCTTEKICLTTNLFGECDQFIGEKDVQRVRIPGNEAGAIRRIEEVSANAMYDCWSMTGEGRLSLFVSSGEERYGLEATKTTCLPCSRIAIAGDVDERWLDKVDINTYMRTELVPGSEMTYLQTFTDRGVGSYASVSEGDFEELKNMDKLGSEPGQELTPADSERVNREMAVVFMQIHPPDIGEVLTNMALAGGTVAGATFMTPVLKGVATKLMFTPVGAVVAVGAVAAGGYGAYNARQGQLTAAAYCGEFTSTEEEAREGCSMVQGVNYNFRDVNALCHSIQGNP